MRTILTALAVAVILVPRASAFNTARELAEAGLSAYQTYGAPQALRIWEYGPSGEDPVAKKLKELRQAFGPVSGFTILAEQQAGGHYSVVYALVRMERAPVFLRLTCYHARSVWRVREIVPRMQPFEFVPGFSASGQLNVVPQGEEESSSGTPGSSPPIKVGATQSSSSE